MASAVKNVPEAAPRPPANRLAVGSLAGTVYVIASLVVAFYALPRIWELVVTPLLASSIGPTFDQALLILAMIGAIAGLGLFGLRLQGPNPPPGQRAGIFCGLVLVYLVLVVTRWIGNILEGLVFYQQLFGSNGVLVGVVCTAALGAVLLFLAARLFYRERFDRFLLRLEEQGWFSLAPYKRSQGQRVRRGTMVSILALAACGIYTLRSHNTLEAGPRDWGLTVPFTGSVKITELGDTRMLGEQANLQVDSVIDRYELRDLNAKLGQAPKVRIANPKDSSRLKKDKEYSREEFDAESHRLREAERTPPTAAELKPATGVLTFQELRLLPHVRFTLPVLLAALALWMGYRFVNYPPFADFLIATEAELNKVSWTSRKRLIQDTVVVLTTMLLITVFLFLVDFVWAAILSNRYIQVLQTSKPAAEQHQEQQEW